MRVHFCQQTAHTQSHTQTNVSSVAHTLVAKHSHTPEHTQHKDKREKTEPQTRDAHDGENTGRQPPIRGTNYLSRNGHRSHTSEHGVKKGRGAEDVVDDGVVGMGAGACICQRLQMARKNGACQTVWCVVGRRVAVCSRCSVCARAVLGVCLCFVCGGVELGTVHSPAVTGAGAKKEGRTSNVQLGVDSKSRYTSASAAAFAPPRTGGGAGRQKPAKPDTSTSISLGSTPTDYTSSSAAAYTVAAEYKGPKAQAAAAGGGAGEFRWQWW